MGAPDTKISGSFDVAAHFEPRAVGLQLLQQLDLVGVQESHMGLADPTIPAIETKEFQPTTSRMKREPVHDLPRQRSQTRPRPEL